LRQKLSEE